MSTFQGNFSSPWMSVCLTTVQSQLPTMHHGSISSRKQGKRKSIKHENIQFWLSLRLHHPQGLTQAQCWYQQIFLLPHCSFALIDFFVKITLTVICGWLTASQRGLLQSWCSSLLFSNRFLSRKCSLAHLKSKVLIPFRGNYPALFLGRLKAYSICFTSYQCWSTSKSLPSASAASPAVENRVATQLSSLLGDMHCHSWWQHHVLWYRAKVTHTHCYVHISYAGDWGMVCGYSFHSEAEQHGEDTNTRQDF